MIILRRFVVLLALLPSLARAAPPADQADWTADPDGGCRLWTLSWLRGDDFVTRWQGPCVDGKAHGVGQAVFQLRRGDGRPVETWRGRFEHGIFLGDAVLAGEIRPLPKNDFLVTLPGDAGTGGRLWILEIAGSDGSLGICSRYGGTVLALTAPDFPLLDEAPVKQAMTAVAAAYHGHCADRADVRVSLVPLDVRFTAGAGSSRTTIEPVLASGLVQAARDGELRVLSYQNPTAAAEQERRRRATLEERRRARDAAAEGSLAAFRSFSHRHGIALWLLPEQLEANPFPWSGRVVGLRARFERMLAPDTALLTGRRGTRLVLEGAPAYLEPGEVVLAAAVDERRGARVVDAAGHVVELQLLHLRHVALRPCGRSCGELFGWTADFDAFPWGRDQSQWLGR